MKLFVDSADSATIAELAKTGLIDGVTTNPSLIAKSGKDLKTAIGDICKLVPGPVSAEVGATETNAMLDEGRALAKIAKNVVVKLPLTEDGLKACRGLRDDNIKVNVTLCFSAAQALLAAKAGASFISPFVGRLDDVGGDGMQLIDDITSIYANYEYGTEVLVASIRSVAHVIEAALIGAHVATVPPAIITAMLKHPLTDKGLAAFLADWKASGQSI